MNNDLLDNIVFKIISLITYNNNFFKKLYLNDLIINISKLSILELKNIYNENNNNLDIYNKIFKDYEYIQFNNELIINYNNNLDNIKKIHNDIILINLDNINDLYLELLEFYLKKN
jgi:hypothetical protein